MRSDTRQSPRAAIRTWLERTEEQEAGDAGSCRHHRPTDPKSEADDARRRRHDTTGRVGNVVRKDKHSGKPTKRTEHDSKRKANGVNSVGLAERLGLHAPFRTFADHDTNERSEQHRRERGPSLSISSPLEPAEESLDQQKNDHKKASEENATILYEHGGPLSDNCIVISDSVPEHPALSENPAKRYERRPRHKTKEDKYEVKVYGSKSRTKRRKKEKRTGEDKQGKKRKRKEKSGDALMHTFSAPNVAQDRLTIRPAAPVGLFGKGRASSPVRRRGLPDLTFSEVTFLDSRKSKPDVAGHQAPEKKRRRKDKAVDAEAAMSRFFTATRADTRASDAEHKKGGASATNTLAQGADDVDKYMRALSLPPLDLPDRPFLGFGSSGATLTSPVKMAIHRNTLCRRSSQSEAGSSRRSSISPSSYYSWSTSAPSVKNQQIEVHAMSPEVRHGLHDTPQAPSPGLRRRGSTSNKNIAPNLLDATEHSSKRQHQTSTEEKLASRVPSEGNDTRLEPHRGVSSRKVMTAQRDGTALDVGSEDKAQMDTQVDGGNKNEKAHVKSDAEHRDHHIASEPGPCIGNDFPLSFDTALESLLRTCKVSLSRSERPTATSIKNELPHGTRSRQGQPDNRERGNNAGSTDQGCTLASASRRPSRRASEAEFSPQPPVSKTNETISIPNPNLPYAKNDGDFPKASLVAEKAELQAQSPERSPSGQEPADVPISLLRQRNGQDHDYIYPQAHQGIFHSGAWHGYQAIYKDQMLPDDDASWNRPPVTEAGVLGFQGEQQWSQEQQPTYAEGTELNYPLDIAEDDPSNGQRGSEDAHDDTHYWDSKSYPHYDGVSQLQQFDDSYSDNVLGQRNPRQFSDSGYGYSTASMREEIYSPNSVFARPDAATMYHDAIASPDARELNSYSSFTTAQNIFHESMCHQRQNGHDAGNESPLANFWRPNRLY